ncbi:diaminobutyrate acetyltransferase [Antrihabitans sp. NCIMB 15449]|jgi:diaminobutyrate acetyltransferase|uniref:L-2,4-diaminobutyric acid acetyltransferase n=1 Tax=Antrihabitans spumae TaxID=3373370 RepID=A0ABW7JHN1_9NOCA
MTQTSDRTTSAAVPDTALRSPQISDGVRLWQIAKASKVLDVNSSYSYLLWCRDFDTTSIVAEVAGDVVGFVTGYIRPHAPDTLFVWQVAVDSSQRGKGLAVRMLDRLLDKTAQAAAPQAITRLETTISPDNPASIALFTSLAKRRNTSIHKQDLFDAGVFPDAHEAEELYTVGPFENRKELGTS